MSVYPLNTLNIVLCVFVTKLLRLKGTLFLAAFASEYISADCF